MRILLVEDNHRLSDSLRLTLEEDGYAVDAAYDGIDGEEMGLVPSYDVIILDIMLPGKDGLEVCRELRDHRITTPIQMLTARDVVRRSFDVITYEPNLTADWDSAYARFLNLQLQGQ